MRASSGGLRGLSVVLGLLLLGPTGCSSDVHEGDVLVRNLADMEDVARYRVVHGSIVVEGDETLARIDWPKLESADRIAIEIQFYDLNLSRSHLESVDLPALTSVGELLVRGPKLREIRLPRLRSARSLAVEGYALRELDLASLAQVGSISVESWSLATLSLPLLAQVGSISVAGKALATLSLPSLARIGPADAAGTSTIGPSAALRTLRLPALATIDDTATLWIDENPALETIELPALATVAGGLNIFNNAKLARVSFDRLAHIAARRSEDAYIMGSPDLARVAAPALGADRDKLGVSLSVPGYTRDPAVARALAERGDLMQVVAGDGDAPSVVLGYARDHKGVFESRGADGALRWSTTTEGFPTLMNPTASGKVAVVTLWSRPPPDPPSGLPEAPSHLAVGLDAATGRALWRVPGTRAWAWDDVALVMEPRRWDGHWEDVASFIAVDASTGRTLSPSVSPTRLARLRDLVPVADSRAAVFDDERDNVVALDGTGVTGRFTWTAWDTVADASGRIIVSCDPRRNLEPARGDTAAPSDHVHRCPDVSGERAAIPAALQDAARELLHPVPGASRYLAATDGRSPPEPLRLGDAVVAPLGGAAPVALIGPRLVLSTHDGRFWIVTLGREAPSVVRVETLAGLAPAQEAHTLDFLSRHALGDHLPIILSNDDGRSWLQLLDVATARVDLALEVDRRAMSRESRHDAPWTEGLLGFDLRLDFFDLVAVWIGAGASGRPEVVSAYQLRDGDGVVEQRLDATPEHVYFERAGPAFGDGLHVASLRRKRGSGAAEDPAESFGAAIIDIRDRRLVWSDLQDLRLVDMTDVVRDVWSAAWRR